MQDTDDRIPKDSIYGTIRMKRRENAASEELARVEEDVDSLPPPPADGQVMIMMMMIVMVIIMMMVMGITYISTESDNKQIYAIPLNPSSSQLDSSSMWP